MAIIDEPRAFEPRIDDASGVLSYVPTTVDLLRSQFAGPILDLRGQETVTGVNTAREAVYQANSAWRYLATVTYEPRNEMDAAEIDLFQERLRGAVNSCRVRLPPRHRATVKTPASIAIAAASGAAGFFDLTWDGQAGTAAPVAWTPSSGEWINVNRRLVRIDTAVPRPSTAPQVTWRISLIQAVHLVAAGAATPGFAGRQGNVVEVGDPYMVCRGAGGSVSQVGANFFPPVVFEWTERLA